MVTDKPKRRLQKQWRYGSRPDDERYVLHSGRHLRHQIANPPSPTIATDWRSNSLAEVKFEQVELGNPSYGCDLSPIDFVLSPAAYGPDGLSLRAP
jgi:hypothetical protein